MRFRLLARVVLTAAALTLVACGGSKGFAPPSAPLAAYRSSAACPTLKTGVPLIIKNQSGLAPASLTLYFTASNPKDVGQFQFLNATGTMTTFAPGNEATAFPLQQCFPGSLGATGAQFKFPLLPGGRIFIAFGKLKIAGHPNGQFAGPSGWVKGDAAYNTPWDFAELSFNNPGIFVNLTRVDMLGLPLELEVFPLAKNKPGSFAQIGEKPNTYATILQALVNAAPFDKSLLLIGNPRVPRVINPSHVAGFPEIFSAYMKTVTNYYAPPRRITYGTAYKGPYCPGAWAANATAKDFTFKQGGKTLSYPLSLFTANYIFADNPSPRYNAGTCEYLLAKIVLQELNRGVMLTPAHPVMTPKTFYGKGTTNNQYACVLHNYSWHNAAYAFAFDDAANQASLIENTAPTSVRITIGAIPKALPKPTKKQACVANY